jgi:nucleotide-binding universal stress UspA family protein
MDGPNSERPVLVAVESLDNVQQLVRTAGDLARLGAGGVRLVTVAVKGSGSPFSVLTDERIVREFAEASHELLDRVEMPEGVTVERDVLVARSAAKGLLAAVEESDPTALVVGWREGGGTDALFGTTVDRLVERAACDLYVERVGREADGVESVLLPVGGGPHVTTAARAAVAIAARNDARVVVFSVDTPSLENGDAAGFVAEGRETVAETDGVPVETSVTSSDDVTDAVVEEAAAHDVVVLGATRQGALRRRLVGSVPRRVVDLTDRTVIVSRNGDAVVGPLARLGGLLRR